MNVPDSLKAIKPYLERGAELKSRDPIVGYHCRLFALQEGMRLRASIPKADMGFILSLMDELEADKSGLGDLDDAGVQLENFGQDLFMRADDADRAGNSDLRTGKAFLVAAHVLECCKQFGELPADLSEKIKYAKVRFVEIAKAVKEGRPPAPPRGTEPPPAPPADDGATDGGELPPSEHSGGPPSYLALPEPPAAPAYDAPPPQYYGAGGYAPAGAGPLNPHALPSSPSQVPGFGAGVPPGVPAGMVPVRRQPTFKPTVAQMREALGQ